MLILFMLSFCVCDAGLKSARVSLACVIRNRCVCVCVCELSNLFSSMCANKNSSYRSLCVCVYIYHPEQVKSCSFL